MKEQPREPQHLSEVRFAAGIAGPFKNLQTGEDVSLSILFEKDIDTGVWIGSCLEHSAYYEGNPGDSLGEVSRLFRNYLLELLNGGLLHDFPPADADCVALWNSIRTNGRMSSAFGDPRQVIDSLADGRTVATRQTPALFVDTKDDLELAA